MFKKKVKKKKKTVHKIAGFIFVHACLVITFSKAVYERIHTVKTVF